LMSTRMHVVVVRVIATGVRLTFVIVVHTSVCCLEIGYFLRDVLYECVFNVYKPLHHCVLCSFDHFHRCRIECVSILHNIYLFVCFINKHNVCILTWMGVQVRFNNGIELCIACNNYCSFATLHNILVHYII
jgi:hypothetical protein